MDNKIAGKATRNTKNNAELKRMASWHGAEQVECRVT